MTKPSINDIFEKTSFLHGSNTVYIEQMFEKYQEDPTGIPNDWKIFFSGITENLQEQNILRASWASKSNKQENEDDHLENVSFTTITKESKKYGQDNIVTSEAFKEQVFDSIRAIRLIRAYRVNGCLLYTSDAADE